MSLVDARERMEDWRKTTMRTAPHVAIGQKTPIMLLNSMMRDRAVECVILRP
jgi:hypothetical protein